MARYYLLDEVPVAGVITKKDEEIVVESAPDDARISRIDYEIWVSGTNRFRSPDEDPPQGFGAEREAYNRELSEPSDPEPSSSREELPDAAERQRLRGLWATMLRRIFEVGPLTCRECGNEMRIVSFIMDPPVIKKDPRSPCQDDRNPWTRSSLLSLLPGGRILRALSRLQECCWDGGGEVHRVLGELVPEASLEEPGGSRWWISDERRARGEEAPPE